MSVSTRDRRGIAGRGAVPALAAAAVAVVGALYWHTAHVAAAPQFTMEIGRDRSGNDIRVEVLDTAAAPEACRDLCAATSGCVAFTFVKQSTTVPKPLCRLKDARPYPHESSCCVSGMLKQ